MSEETVVVVSIERDDWDQDGNWSGYKEPTIAFESAEEAEAYVKGNNIYTVSEPIKLVRQGTSNKCTPF